MMLTTVYISVIQACSTRVSHIQFRKDSHPLFSNLLVIAAQRYRNLSMCHLAKKQCLRVRQSVENHNLLECPRRHYSLLFLLRRKTGWNTSDNITCWFLAGCKARHRK
jgi:hypothetical protein